jgi:TIR domain
LRLASERVPGIFLSYRREDAGGQAGRLYDTLVSRFGSEFVFRDIDTLVPGADFLEHIERSIASADVVLAVIGRDWASARDANGQRRLLQPDDYVRLELEAALSREIPTIPVLVRNATMPAREDLPEGLAPLVRRHAFELPDHHWPFAVEALIQALETMVPASADPTNRAAAHADEHRSFEALWGLARSSIHVDDLRPELLGVLKSFCRGFATDRPPAETVVTFATAGAGTWERLLILTSDVLEIHNFEWAQRLEERHLIPLANIERIRAKSWPQRLDLRFETPVAGEKQTTLLYVAPRGRAAEIAGYVQSRGG